MSDNKRTKPINIVLLIVAISLSIVGLVYLISVLVLWLGPMISGYPGVPIYNIDQIYDYDSCNILLAHDEKDEKFVYYYTDKDSKSNIFYFDFTYNTITTLHNSSEFIYTDSEGNELIFNENGRYEFLGDVTIYISYKNASQEIKTAISEHIFSLNFGVGSFRSAIKAYPVE